MSAAEKIMNLLADGRERWAGEIAERLKCNPEAVQAILTRKVKAGELVSEEIPGLDRNGYQIPARAAE